MNFIGFVTLSIIFGLNIIHADKHSKIYQHSDHRSLMRRNVVSDGVLSFDTRAVQPVLTSFDKVARNLLRSIRSDKDTVSVSITCKTDADCADLGSTYVCLTVTVLSVGICVSKVDHNAATSMINSKNILYAFILSGLILTLN